MTQQEYEHIVPELRPRLKDIGRQFFGDEEMAEDIAQETLMRLWLLRDRIDPQTDIKPLVVRMAKNLCVSEWRKQKVRQENALQVEVTAHEDIHRNVELKEEIVLLLVNPSMAPPPTALPFKKVIFLMFI